MLFHSMIRGGGLKLAISNAQTNVNLFALAGSPSGPIDVELTILSSAIVGSTDPAKPALDIGQFPTGSSISIINLGQIQGAGGAGGTMGNGGAGGDAVKANYANLFVVFLFVAGVSFWAGGGGGTGGQGYYNYTVTTGAGSLASNSYNCDYSCQLAYGSNYFCYSNCYFDGSYSASNGSTCGTCAYTAIAYTSGGAGGNGGGGGNGGRGQGYYQASALGGGGLGGAAGAGGGADAGAGGSVRTGGAGGNGGAWGAGGGEG